MLQEQSVHTAAAPLSVAATEGSASPGPARQWVHSSAAMRPAGRARALRTPMRR
eukprot:CAMPEP_0206005994 /NCGR_PEP_ID=MMETSP1464-20131121/4917_1 /ASSEMBLY_ACC=CAM_ASM_001124 /TAXON_ID=119497 /ORGANISM="Exanthemachrysis gayraliae, Strain RCC1523" /LENGTH=53 /DNA_ID=CAMNT_0053379457 /DNA_START=275 /DNA_END=432 /DNA_ORIENTATION=-